MASLKVGGTPRDYGYEEAMTAGEWRSVMETSYPIGKLEGEAAPVRPLRSPLTCLALWPPLVVGVLAVLAASRTLYRVSQFDMRPATFGHMGAGMRLGDGEAPRDAPSPVPTGSRVPLAVVRLVGRVFADLTKATRVAARWRQPRRFDCGLVATGPGPAGFVAAHTSDAPRAEATRIEAARMRRGRLNTGRAPGRQRGSRRPWGLSVRPGRQHRPQPVQPVQPQPSVERRPPAGWVAHSGRRAGG